MAREIEEFVIGFKRQRMWGWPIATALFTAGMGSGLFMIALWMERQMGIDFNAGLILGLVIGALATSAAFIFDLGRKERFWRVMLKPATSWLSRGIILILAMVIFGALYMAPRWLPLPWNKMDSLGTVFQIISAIAAFGVMIYSGFLLAYSSSIPFWNTTLLPIVAVSYSLMGGVGAIFALNLALGGLSIDFKTLELVEIFLIIISFILIMAYLLTMFYSTVAAKKAASILFKSRLAWSFLGGVIVVGLLIPFIITLSVYFSGASASEASLALVVAGILELTGGWLFRFCLLRVGVYSPVL